MRTLIGIFRLSVFLLSAIVTIIYQSIVLLFTRGRFALIYPRAYHAFLCRLFNIKVVVEGDVDHDGPIVYLGNHVSYLDIPIIGSIVSGGFVAKKEVEQWPVFGILGKMGQTIYISRAPADAARETETLLKQMDRGLPLIIFPEGTSSNGKSIFPFKSSFFQIFLNKNIKIQPFTISVMSVDGKPAITDATRDLYAWYGDMTLEPHLWAVAKGKGAVIKVTFQKTILCSSFSDRKQLCNTVYGEVVRGLDLSGLAS